MLPDLIITDMHMPEMDGLSFTQTLRAGWPDARVVLLTSGMMPTGADARVFNARLLKPCRQSQLFNALHRLSVQQAALSGALSSQAKGVSQAPEQLHQRILVADDNAINLKVAQAMLAKLGHSTATAVNGVEAAELVAQSLSGNSGATPFAAVLMDANMPVMDGLQSTRLILLRHGTAAPPIIALTASVLEEDRQSCMDAGMQGFLAKPLRLDELGQALKRYAAGSQIAIKKGAACAVFIKAAALNDSENDAGNKSVLMDWSRLEQFRQFDDNALSMTREIVSLFIKDAPGRCTALQAALASSSSAGLSQAAHALKGSASNVGASAVQDACARLEQSCLQGTWPPDAASQIDCTSALCQSTVTVLQRWLRSCN